MSDAELAFLEAICADRECDTPRLVFADWLEQEGGQPERGEFIRVQCELWRSYPEEMAGRGDYLLMSAGGTYAKLRARERELLGGSPCKRCDWHAGIKHWPLVKWEWFRGFPSSITCTYEDWAAHADAVYWHPEQTAPCTHKGGEMQYGYWRHPFENCPDCKGTGRVARPFPPTAQPLTEVTLTDPSPWPEWTGQAGKVASRWPDGRAKTFHSSRWPGLTFNLPQRVPEGRT